jgi:hypothetical protein
MRIRKSIIFLASEKNKGLLDRFSAALGHKYILSFFYPDAEGDPADPVISLLLAVL